MAALQPGGAGVPLSGRDLILLYLPLMMILHAKDYYLAAIYPLYVCRGGRPPGDLLFRKAWFFAGAGSRPVYVAMNVLLIAIQLPTILPVLPPAKILAYQQRHHLQPQKRENATTSPLPQLYADMLDWRQKADLLAAAWYCSLPQAEGAHEAVIYTEN